MAERILIKDPGMIQIGADECLGDNLGHLHWMGFLLGLMALRVVQVSFFLDVFGHGTS